MKYSPGSSEDSKGRTDQTEIRRSKRTQSQKNRNLSLVWLTHNCTLLSYFLPLSLSHTQSIYRQCPEKIRCSRSDTGLSNSVRETNMHLCLLPQAWCQDRCCRASLLRSGPSCSLSEGDILKRTLISRSFTYSTITPHHCIAVAGLRWVVGVCVT